jgi:benzoate membrane transport protein
VDPVGPGPLSPAATATSGPGLAQPALAGVVTALVGFTSAFAVVLTGLASVGASTAEAASGLLVVCVTMGLGCILFSWRTRIPVTMAWSTPGAALLAGATVPGGGYGDAVGAFALAGALYAVTGLVRPLAGWVAAIPPALANAMLAGVLLGLCVEPFRALVDEPAAIAPVLLTWLVVLRLARRWAVPAALLAALVVVVVTGSLSELGSTPLAPHLTWTTPTFDLATVVAIGLPLYVVTMTSQNIPGVAVLASFGYRAPLSPALVYAGGATVATAGLGGFSINLGAISAAISAGPGSHPDPERRWVAGVVAGASYLLVAPFAALVSAVALAAPAGLVASVAGVALLGTFGSAAGAALADGEHREGAAVTFVVAASGVVVAGIGPAFWALLAGGLVLLVLRAGLVRA